MTLLALLRPRRWLAGARALFYRLVRAPLPVLGSVTLSGVATALALILMGLVLHQPATAQWMGAAAFAAPLMPPDFTPVASPPPAFSRLAATDSLAPTAPALALTEPPVTAVAPPAASPPTSTLPLTASPTMALASPTVEPTVTPVSLDELLAQEGQTSVLANQRLVTLLLLGTDARPNQPGPSRTDTMMVAVLNLEASSVTLISIPRDLWVSIPGYGANRINTAFFMGELTGNGPEVARQTASQVLGIPISYTVVVDFNGFREFVDSIGGIDVDVPQAIDDPLFPDDSYGTYRLVIPAGPQHMDGETALAYARTRHGSSDIERAERQQAVMQAVRERLLTPDQVTALPGHLRRAADDVRTTLSLPDMFFLARFVRNVDEARIYNHVLRPPMLWNGVLADGAQVLLYDPYSVQQSVQQWLYEASFPAAAER